MLIFKICLTLLVSPANASSVTQETRLPYFAEPQTRLYCSNDDDETSMRPSLIQSRCSSSDVIAQAPAQSGIVALLGTVLVQVLALFGKALPEGLLQSSIISRVSGAGATATCAAVGYFVSHFPSLLSCKLGCKQDAAKLAQSDASYRNAFRPPAWTTGPYWALPCWSTRGLQTW